jgi:co-chaperonin GroES (HSP10)
LIPLLDRVVINKIKPAEKTASGLYIPEKSQESLQQGTVVAVGPGDKVSSQLYKSGSKLCGMAYRIIR